jgi:hypothetical protein
MKTTRKTNSAQRLMVAFSAAIALSGATGAIAGTYSATVLADNPIAYYRLEELPGATVVMDSSASGAYSGSYNFDDSGNYPKLGQGGIDTNSVFFHVYPGATGVPSAEIPFYPELNPAGPFAVEVWLRPTSDPTTDSRCALSSWGGNGSAYDGWFIYQTSGPDSDWVWIQRVGDIWLQAPGATKFEWSHLVGSFDGTNTSFYVNGQFQAKSATNGTPNTSLPLYFGCRGPGDLPFDGDMDEVAIYTNALTASQILTHYQVGLTNIRVALAGPTITPDPADTTAYAGRLATFQAGADGTAPLSYQWYRNSFPINGATDDTLSFTCAYADNGAGYHIVITNLYGSATSAVATLTVSTDLLLTASPASITRSVGSMAAFIVSPDGALPFSYQWYKGAPAVPINGATNQTLWLSKVQLADDTTTYYAQVNNPFGGATNSDPATLNVVPRTTDVPLNRYGQVVAADSPVAYWRLDQADATSPVVDAVGSFDGASDDNGGLGTFTFGVPTGIPHETNTAMKVSGGATVQIPYALELNPFGPFSVEGWFQPATVAATSDDYRSAMGCLGNGNAGPTGWHLYQGGNNLWALIVWNASWNGTGWFTDFDDTIAAQNWYHVVVVYDGTLFRLYVNSAERFASPYPDFVQNSDSPLVLGWGYSPRNPFDGVIDDVAVYNKALTPAQVQAHYFATVRLNIAESGGKIVLSWPFGTLQQSSAALGTYTNLVGVTSPYTNAPSSTAFFRVKAY